MENSYVAVEARLLLSLNSIVIENEKETCLRYSKGPLVMLSRVSAFLLTCQAWDATPISFRFQFKFT